MSSETSTRRTFRFGLVTIAALVLSLGLACGIKSLARAQSDDSSDDSSSDQPQRSYAPVPDVTPSDADDPNAQAQAGADAAQEQLDSATQARDELESSGASQDQIDAANAAIAQARAEKDSADAAVQNAGSDAQPQGDAQNQ